MNRRLYRTVLLVVVSAWVLTGLAEPASQRSSPEFASMARNATRLAERGHCSEALPMLEKIVGHLTDRELLYKVGFSRAQCAMSLGRNAAVFQALSQLHRDFPDDPHVLYVTAQYCSMLAEKAARDLAEKAPDSYQAQQLEAEAFEAHAQWEKAEAQYRKILQQYPDLPNIHYRIARIVLAKPGSPSTLEQAQKELEAELKSNPNSATAEFLLGDLARQQQMWDSAIDHFSRATKVDVGFSEAYLGLGMVYNAAGQYSQAVGPLETYVKSQPDDAAGHQQLAMAYARAGRKEDAARELQRQRELNERLNKEQKQ